VSILPEALNYGDVSRLRLSVVHQGEGASTRAGCTNGFSKVPNLQSAKTSDEIYIGLRLSPCQCCTSLIPSCGKIVWKPA